MYPFKLKIFRWSLYKQTLELQHSMEVFSLLPIHQTNIYFCTNLLLTIWEKLFTPKRLSTVFTDVLRPKCFTTLAPACYSPPAENRSQMAGGNERTRDGGWGGGCSPVSIVGRTDHHKQLDKNHGTYFCLIGHPVQVGKPTIASVNLITQ